MALPTKEELTVLETFREKVADILSEDERSDDMYLLRWLRARDLDLIKAETMLRNAKEWRKKNGLDTMNIGNLLNNPYYKENFPNWVDGVDREGRPVYTAEFGKWDLRKVVKLGKSEEFIAYLTEDFEQVYQAVKTSSTLHPPAPGSPPITQTVAIYDWEGFSWGQLLNYQAVQNFLEIGSIYEAYYPEMLHTCYFINCPYLISTALALLKPVLAPKTMDKIKCFSDKKAWQAEILQYIDADQLRPRFGGTKDNDLSPFN